MEDQSDEKDPEALRAADYAYLLMMPISEEAEAAVEDLFNQVIAWEFAQGHRKRNPKADVADRMRSTIAALLGDLLIATLNVPAEGYCRRSSKKPSFQYCMAEYRLYQVLRRAWQALGYMDVVNGFRGFDTWIDGEVYHPDSATSNWQSRLRATPKLLNLLEGYEITPMTTGLHFRRNLALSQPIVLKASKKGSEEGKYLDFERTDRVRELEAEVTEINAFLADHMFSFGPAPYLYRSFSDGDVSGFDWNLGGRFYARGKSYLNWSSEERRQMTIDGDPVVEIDVTACQLTLLHALMDEPLDLSGDPFQIDGMKRATAKKTFNVIVGLGHLPEEDAEDETSERRAREREILVARYPALERIEAEGWNSLKLQAVDANIMADALLTLFRRHDIPALPVHDCLIVRVQDADVAEAVFKEVFKKKVGVEPLLKRE